VSLIKWDDRGLCVAIAQDRLTGTVRMVAWMNDEALQRTLTTRRATFFSRSRNRLWTKGEESGHHLAVHDVRIDCDADSILLLVDPGGPSCHTGEQTCFFADMDGDKGLPAVPALEELARDIEARRGADAGKSYTKSLLDAGAGKIGDKLREEADELSRAIAGEADDRVASEAADVLYHLMVGIASRGVSFRTVLGELAKRRGVSGLEEKASRPR
jgi:phosphoribosyl-AMP cyclohydrolase / phosphoribosyl-ATP pyrophosphohydrolase